MPAIIEELLENPTRENLEKLRRKYSSGGHVPKNADILALCTPAQKEKLLLLLRTKPVRSKSGIVVVAVMYPGATCPGKCTYCPQGPGAPQSYTGLEPAARRARQNSFDPYRQTTSRLRQLKEAGHPTDKTELILMGATFPSESHAYQTQFVKKIFDGLNGKASKTISHAHKLNETAGNRCVGLTFETRPDFCTKKEIGLMLKLGVTRVELGTQSIYDDVLQKVNRGHDVQTTKGAIRLLKQSGMKVCLHIMPGLPEMNPKRDLQQFRDLFSNPGFCPDMLKIYPCLVIKGTPLYKQFKAKKYTPYDTETTVNLVAKATKYFPPYLRIMRMQRDIPVEKIVAGVKKSHITQLVNRKLAEQGQHCPCIRCREVGHNPEAKYDWKPKQFKYGASGGTEYFLSFEDTKKDVLAAFLRLRIDQDNSRVRELRVFGQALKLGGHGTGKHNKSEQHHGMGQALLETAEGLSEHPKLSITSAVGTRAYYRKFGYRKSGSYMAKTI